MEYFRAFGNGAASPGRFSEASFLFASSEYLSLSSDDICELVREISRLVSRSCKERYRESLRKIGPTISDVQVSNFGVFELAASRYEVPVGFQRVAGVVNPDLLLADIEHPAAFSAASRGRRYATRLSSPGGAPWKWSRCQLLRPQAGTIA